MVLWALANAHGAELFVPRIPSYRITDVAEAIGPTCEKPVTGIRPGEKIHEEMITAADSFTTVDLGNYYAILPTSGPSAANSYCQRTGAQPVPEGFAYSSGSNPAFLSVSQIRELIVEHLNPDFQPV